MSINGKTEHWTEGADQGTLCSCPPGLWVRDDVLAPVYFAPTAFLLPDRFLTRPLKEREGSDELGFRPIHRPGPTSVTDGCTDRARRKQKGSGQA